MPKGVQRSNREQKKPKQAKKPVAAPSATVVTPSRMPPPAVEKKK